MIAKGGFFFSISKISIETDIEVYIFAIKNWLLNNLNLWHVSVRHACLGMKKADLRTCFLDPFRGPDIFLCRPGKE